MKQTITTLLATVLLTLGQSAFAQGFTPPAAGNAAVYFARVSGFGGATSYEYFDGGQFIGIFKGKNYMRYECPAGKHLLWASSEDKEFLDCDLKAGETYLILVNVEMGAWKARVGLEPLDIDHEVFERARKLVMSKKPIETSQVKIDATMKKLEERGFIEDIMQKYETSWKNTDHRIVVTPEMSIPKDKLD